MKIKLVKEIEGFDVPVGTEFNMKASADGGFVTFESEYGYGMMSPSQFEKYFEKIIPESLISEWTGWINAAFYKYTTNYKKIVVMKNGIKASAKCREGDTFSLHKGIDLCLARVSVKEGERLEEMLNAEAKALLNQMRLTEENLYDTSRILSARKIIEYDLLQRM